MTMSLSASLGALLMASAAFMTYDFITYRTSLIQNLSTLAEIISFNTASAVVFNDSSAAVKSLGSLKARPSILSAGIYASNAQAFASWHRYKNASTSLPVLSAHQEESYRFERGSLVLLHPMILDYAPIGTVYIESDLTDIAERLRRYAGIAAGVLAISIVVAALISFKVGQKIAEPIMYLTQTAKDVSQKKDYSVRARGGGPDEVGLLVRTFNEMLTEIEQAEEEIRKLNESLERKVAERTAELTAANKEMEAFSYSVSHDLRAPLRHIAGYSDLLQNDATSKFSETGGRYLKTILESIRQMGRLIDDLLAFSRMSRIEMIRTSVSLDRMIREILRELEGETQGRQIEWKIDPLPEVQGDPSMLRQVLVNLISNALKYTRLRPQTVIEIGLRPPKEKGEHAFFIRDNGVGFDMQYANKLFGVFQRLHSAQEFEGTGIGLANVQRIIHRHGGRVWAEGRVGEGAIFCVALPGEENDAINTPVAA